MRTPEEWKERAERGVYWGAALLVFIPVALILLGFGIAKHLL